MLLLSMSFRFRVASHSYIPTWGGVLEYLGSRKDKIREIVIATNGSIVPDDELLKIIRRNDAVIRISDYGRFPDRLAVLRQKCKSFGIRHRMYAFGTGDSTWFQCGGKEVKRELDGILVRNRFRRCAFKNCLTLERGELSHCSRASNSYHIQGFSRKKKDFLKITDDKKFGKQLRRYVIFPKPMEACFYCYGSSMKHTIPAAIQEGESGNED